MDMTIGDRIRKRRVELGMTQEELARKLGYKSKSSINKIELNGRNLMQPKIKAIADALDTTPAYIMGWDRDAYYIDEEAAAFAEFLRSHPEYRGLFDASRKVKAEDLEKAVRMLGIFTEDEK